jgi:hypothetical protein
VLEEKKRKKKKVTKKEKRKYKTFLHLSEKIYTPHKQENFSHRRDKTFPPKGKIHIPPIGKI